MIVVFDVDGTLVDSGTVDHQCFEASFREVMGSLKLNAAGFDLAGIPMATSSERSARADIIRLAIERAGRSLDEAVYVGDGPWDLRATQQLGIPFIGVGRKVARLREAGARHTLDDFSKNELPGLLAQVAPSP